MKPTLTVIFPRILSICAAVALQLVLVVSCARSEEKKLTEPVYRVATETTAAQPAAATQTAAGAPAALAATTATRTPLDFTRKDDKEHPLAPVIRNLKISQEILDHEIRDYSCTFKKCERVDGELGDYQIMLLKVMHQPFSVYMAFQKPYPGREVVYVDGQNDGKLTVLESGFARIVGKLNLDPTGTKAMSGQRHPITDVGIRNLTAKLTKMWEAEMKFAECDVTTKPGTKVEGRKATMVQIVHPVPRQNFKFHVARLFFDEELQIPVHFDAYTWPAQQGGEPQLEESYTYAMNLKTNTNLTARDFDANNNPEIFKK
jgi:Protein of unknown function (DUF1571)